MNIFNNIKKWAVGLTAGTMLLYNLSCKKDDVINPPKNNPPQVSLHVSPIYGTSPLSVRIRGEGTDPDGMNDIVSYRTVMKNNINSDSLVFTKNPLDTTLTLLCPPGPESITYNFKSEIKDKANAGDTKTANVVVNKKPNSAPTINLNVSPLSGRSPLNVRIQANATDPDSLEDIIDYGVVIQHANGSRDTITNNPLDTTATFYDSKDISAYVKDRSGFQDRKGPIRVQVNRPSLVQTATLENLVNIRYRATFSNLDSARLLVSKNSQQIISKMIRPNENQIYDELFSYSTNTNITKGDYTFTSIWKNAEGRDSSITTNITIRNFLPNLDFGGVVTNLNEEDSLNINLQSKLATADKNPEDNPVPLRSARSLDGKTQVSVNGNILKIIALGENSGIYRAEIEYGSNEGGINTSEFFGEIYDFPRIQGRLESNETHLGVQGTLIAYEILGNDTLRLPTKTSDPQKRNFTDANGNFNFKINRRSYELTKILLMARQGMPGNYMGWVRVIEIPSKDTSGVLMRVVPYGDYAANPDQFVQFKLELNGSFGRRFDLNGEWLRGYPGFENFNGLERIRVLSHGYFSDSLTFFTPEQQNNIRNKILDPNDISGIIGFYNIDPNKIVLGNDPTFTDYIARESVHGVPGWGIEPRVGVIVVTPKTDLGGGVMGLAVPKQQGFSLVSHGTIYLRGGGSDGGISHEFGHMFIAGGHSTIFGSDQTVMTRSSGRPNTGPADKKLGKINYEPTYMIQFDDPSLPPNIDYIDNILRRDFK